MLIQKEKNNGQFPKGTRGNPLGRPQGSRNKSTLMIEALLEDEGLELVRKAIELAKAGDIQALRFCLERMMPPRRERCVEFQMPPIRGQEDISAGIAGILAAVSEGKLTPQEGETISRILAQQANVMANQDAERRLAELEPGG